MLTLGDSGKFIDTIIPMISVPCPSCPRLVSLPCEDGVGSSGPRATPMLAWLTGRVSGGKVKGEGHDQARMVARIGCTQPQA